MNTSDKNKKDIEVNKDNNVLLNSKKGKIRTSETIRGEFVKLISDHIPKHQKPLNDTEFGYYLAGLIDGDGHFNASSLSICFYSSDISSAYYLKGKLQFGTVRPVRNKNAVVFSLQKNEGLLNVLKLINNKMRTESKLFQVKRLISSKISLGFDEEFNLDTTEDLLNNH